MLGMVNMCWWGCGRGHHSSVIVSAVFACACVRSPGPSVHTLAFLLKADRNSDTWPEYVTPE